MAAEAAVWRAVGILSLYAGSEEGGGEDGEGGEELVGHFGGGRCFGWLVVGLVRRV